MDQGLIFQDPLQGIWPWPKLASVLTFCASVVLNIILLTTVGKQEKCMTDATLGFNLNVEKSET